MTFPNGFLNSRHVSEAENAALFLKTPAVKHYVKIQQTFRFNSLFIRCHKMGIKPLSVG